MLFFLKKVDDEEILESMNACVRYILERQQQLKQRLVYFIYAEEWVIQRLPEGFYQQTYTRFEKWPPENNTESGQSIINYNPK